MFLKLGFIIDHLLVKVVIGDFDENSFSGVVGIKVNLMEKRMGNQELEIVSISSSFKKLYFPMNREIFCSQKRTWRQDFLNLQDVTFCMLMETVHPNNEKGG